VAAGILSAERLHELLDYDPQTGIFTRKVRTAQRHQVGDRADLRIAKGPMAGYRRVAIDSTKYLAHRLAWLYVYGVWPEHQIDHVDTDRGHNWITNLRDVCDRVNKENRREPRKDNTSGFLGVLGHAETGKWRSADSVCRKGQTHWSL
jgi:hypothetical protein